MPRIHTHPPTCVPYVFRSHRVFVCPVHSPLLRQTAAHTLLIYAYAEPLTHSHAARGLIGSHHCVVPARTFLISHLTTFNYIERRRSECRAELGGVRCSVFCALVAMMLCHGALLFTPTTAATVCSRNSVTVARHTRTHSRNITQTQP